VGHRAPEPGELRQLKLDGRKAKILVTRTDLQRAWDQTAARHEYAGYGLDYGADRPDALSVGHQAVGRSIEDRVEQRLTEKTATFEPGELRRVVLEQSVGQLAPGEALARAGEMIAERRILPLEGGMLTTLSLRAREQAVERRHESFAQPAGRDVGEHARKTAAGDVAERIGAPLSREQTNALRTLTGDERAAVLVGPAGTGKGVVIDAAARAEQYAGSETIGIAVSWDTAQRLGRDSPALEDRVFSLDAFVARVQSGRLQVDERTTVFFDEAGMADTHRLDKLSEVIEQTGAKIVYVGDASAWAGTARTHAWTSTGTLA
jgi:hypothetical protein